MSKPQSPKIQRILVIRIGRLGDTILATPVIDVLRQRFGQSVEIDFVTSDGASAVIMAMEQRVDRVFPVTRRRLYWRLNPDKRQLEEHSRRRPYDLVINLECGTECDDFIRFVHHGEFVGRPLVAPKHQADRHCVDTEKSIVAERLGVTATANAMPSLQVDLSDARLPVDGERAFVILNPGFSGAGHQGYRGHRGWPIGHWNTLIDLILTQTGMQILINGTAKEQGIFASLLKHKGVFSLFGSDLSTLMVALTKSRGLVSVDTGTMHLAAALGTPVVALFGPGNPVLTGPYTQPDRRRVLSAGISCQPCVRTAAEKACPFNRCMDELQPTTVLDNLKQLISV